MRHAIVQRQARILVLAFLAAAVPHLTSGGQAAEPSIGYSVRVVAGETPLFAQANARSPLVGRAQRDDTLVVIGKENAWYKVRVPRNRRLSPTGPASAYVEARAVVVIGVGGATEPSAGAARPGVARPGAVPPASRRGAHGWGRWQIRPFVNVAVQSFTASDSFKAVFGSPTGLFYGGGLEVGIGRALRVAGGVSHFSKTGERAFASNGEAFPLGIPLKVGITPIEVNLTYRVFTGKWLVAYAGGGAGAVLYRETSDFAEAGDNVSKTGSAFQVLGGVELPLARGVSVAVEGQYQGVRGVLGSSGVSQAFGERDLGGASARVRVILGR